MTRTTVLSLMLACTIGLNAQDASRKATQQEKSSPGTKPDSLFLENAYVHVQRNKASFGPANSSTMGTRLIVALGKLKVKSGRRVQDLERGGVAAFKVNESYDPPTGEYFEVAFKKDHPPLKAPEEWIEPTKNTIVYEDDEIRAFEERLEGGDERSLHSHAQRVVVRLNEVQLTDPRFARSKSPGAGLQVPNTVRFAEPIVHVVKNLSSIPLFNIVIEYKLPRSK